MYFQLNIKFLTFRHLHSVMSSKVSSLHGTIDEVVEVLRRDHNMEEEVMLWLKGTFEMK